MHTLDLGSGWRAHHNDDWSGDVKLRDPEGVEHVVPVRLMVRVVAEVVRAAKLDELEEADPAEVLGVGPGRRAGL